MGSTRVMTALVDRVVLFIKACKNIGHKLVVSKSHVGGRHVVSKGSHLVVVFSDRELILLVVASAIRVFTVRARACEEYNLDRSPQASAVQVHVATVTRVSLVSEEWR
jgi:hypothetical protein